MRVLLEEVAITAKGPATASERVAAKAGFTWRAHLRAYANQRASYETSRCGRGSPSNQ